MKDKIKAFSKSAGELFGSLGIILIILKLIDAISWPWVLILAPFWMPFFLVMLVFIITLIVALIACR